MNKLNDFKLTISWEDKKRKSLVHGLPTLLTLSNFGFTLLFQLEKDIPENDTIH